VVSAPRNRHHACKPYCAGSVCQAVTLSPWIKGEKHSGLFFPTKEINIWPWNVALGERQHDTLVNWDGTFENTCKYSEKWFNSFLCCVHRPLLGGDVPTWPEGAK
jgi:hypothetical protein